MTRQGSRKAVSADHWRDRLGIARNYRQAAQDALDLADPGQNCGPAVSNAVLAAIAFADAITARKSLVVNQLDHAFAPRLLRDVLGNALPDIQEQRFRRLLGKKDEAQYGVRRFDHESTQRLLVELDRFAEWAEDVLR